MIPVLMLHVAAKLDEASFDAYPSGVIWLIVIVKADTLLLASCDRNLQELLSRVADTGKSHGMELHLR